MALTLVAAALAGTSTSASAATAANLSAAPAATVRTLPGDQLPFASAVFKATHNSYEGGDRGSIIQQLDAGSRFVEFDIWDSKFWQYHDYRLGHSWAGNSVDKGNGNPDTDLLKPWLETVANWSRHHPTHAPITVMVDLKNNASGNNDAANGNLVALNAELTAAFGSTLVPAKSVTGALGTVGSLRGKILTLISGNPTSRLAYKRDLGHNPAVAINRAGQVVEVDSDGSSLCYWSGKMQPDGTVLWRAHGRYDSGATPAVAVTTAGRVVEVHKSQSNDGLWSSVGTIAANGEIVWTAAEAYGQGETPTVSFTSQAGLQEIHKRPGESLNGQHTGVLGARAVSWGKATTTTHALYRKTSAAADGNDVSVFSGGDQWLPLTTLRYTTNHMNHSQLITYEQVAFLEVQPGEDKDPEFTHGAIFYGGPSSDTSFIEKALKAGHVVRGWDFDAASRATSPLATFPATNEPYASWYKTMLANNDNYVGF